jgi:hypothetical protein
VIDVVEPVADEATASPAEPVAADVASSASEIAITVPPTPHGGWPDTDRPEIATPIHSAPPPADPAPVATPRKPTRFMEELTKAMRAAAETTREESVGRFQADAKTFIEEVHAESAGEADALRAAADEDIARIREWSKAEIARIREETDQRISDRKAGLDAAIEEHAARIEARIERVQARVGSFEAAMAEFFELMLAEDDPARFAAMAENLPEPPALDVTDEVSPEVRATTVPEEVVVTPDPVEPDPWAGVAFAAPVPDPVDDPRIAALGLSGPPDHPAATNDTTVVADDVVPDTDLATDVELRSTRVVVLGLVSVASIASFKRHLGHLPGVRAVGVSSGPSGEFVFAVEHETSVALPDAISGLPGFAALITSVGAGVVEVAARDPESTS